MTAQANVSSLDPVVALAKRRGFIFPSSEIYGGLGSCYDYGPLGTELKRNVKDAWWQAMVRRRDDIVGLDPDDPDLHNRARFLLHESARPPYLLRA